MATSLLPVQAVNGKPHHACRIHAGVTRHGEHEANSPLFSEVEAPLQLFLADMDCREVLYADSTVFDFNERDKPILLPSLKVVVGELPRRGAVPIEVLLQLGRD